jgi:UDP-3-O-[3-hydroxymyristoyl] glucosamine N-acyltransferase
MGFWKTVAVLISTKFEQSWVNWSSLNIAFGLGVTTLSNMASMTGGIKGVGVMVGVSLTAGVKVIVGERVMVGERVIVGERVVVGVRDAVGEGGK